MTGNEKVRNSPSINNRPGVNLKPGVRRDLDQVDFCPDRRIGGRRFEQRDVPRTHSYGTHQVIRRSQLESASGSIYQEVKSHGSC